MIIVTLVAAAWGLGAVPQMSSGDRGEPDRAQLEAAFGAIETLDLRRAESDRAYAQAVLAQVDILAPVLRSNEAGSRQLLVIRSVLLDRLGRRPEALAIIEGLLAAQPTTSQAYLQIFGAAGGVQEPALMVRSIEGVTRTLGSADPAPVFEALTPASVYSLNSILKERGMDAERVRLAEAVIAMGWQRADPSKLDYFRLFLLDRRLAEGRRDEAARFAREISSPFAFLPLLVRKRYDGLIEQGGELLQRKLEEEDRGTESLVRAAPTDVEAVLDRASYLRTVGRNADALALLQPWLANVSDTARRGENASWIINQGADTLIALGRSDEAHQLMRSLIALDGDDHRGVDLIGPSINHSGMLWQTGRAADSLAHLERLGPLAERYANEYGKLWIASHTVCANVGLDRREAAEAKLGQLRRGAASNGAALNQALLCLNDLDASERLMVERLSSDEPNDALLALQDYSIQSPAGEITDILRARLRAVRDRPAVRAAIERIGRIVTLPIDRAYHGSF
jgi:hypothetical protein